MNEFYDTQSAQFQELDIREKLSIYRQLKKEGKLSLEDMKEIIKYLREDRTNLVAKSVKKIKEAKAEVAKIEGSTLLSDLNAALGLKQ